MEMSRDVHQKRRAVRWGWALTILLGAAPAAADGVPAAPADFFERRIRPLLVERCLGCHGAEEAAGRLRLDSRAGWQQGGERGPAITPGDPSASLLIRAVTHHDEKLRMPPEEAGGRLTDDEVEDLSNWIRGGAFDPRDGERVVTDIDTAAARHWAFQPIVAPVIAAGDHPVDALVEQMLRERGFTPNGPADAPTLVRRATFDLVGLPPTARQLATPPAEFSHLLAELLAAPQYGERWGRHWLDVARYSDAKDGVLMYGDARIRPFAHTYRDYVIRAFNEDRPFDRFVREQIAADRLGLPADSPDLAALGLLTLGRLFDGNRHDVIDDQIDVVGRGFLGLSLACARCHDHKFDPVPTADYYSLYGVFASTVEPIDRPRIGPVAEAGRAFEDEYAAKLVEIMRQQQTHHAEVLLTARERTPDYLVHIATTGPDVAETSFFFLSLTPEQLRPQITRRWRQLVARRAFADDPLFGPWHDLVREMRLRPEEWTARGVDQRVVTGLVAAAPTSMADVARAYGAFIRDAWRAAPGGPDPLAALLTAADGPVWFPARDVAGYLSRTPGDAFRGLVGSLDAIAVKHAEAAPRALVVRDAEVACDPVIFQRGDPAARGAPVPRRFLGILTPGERRPFVAGSGRLELADAITAPSNPLTARVWANRVWMHHFGAGLVDDPGDFGLQSPRPVHHELLDYLADFLIRNGWRTKPLHELIMTSRSYQRSSRIPDDPVMTDQARRDPANTLLWRGSRKRLDLEQMRDALLAVAGDLDATMFGRPLPITDGANRRRTIYSFVERQNIPAIFATFDAADPDTVTPRRGETTVPQQALFALNAPFMLARADALAARTAAPEPAAQVAELFRLVFGRAPTAAEAGACGEFLGSASPAQLAQVLLMSNEFMFID